ncbi:hypothetical protein TIFTF001_012230 [Ficus carica]|uniref:Uncharacterized protein n=1 Tax=Ficus carica TaxID=3494 RepID=A0AA87ZZZ5_FICCA|nr:hypothetical protein TIFTF001_012230 [Ficus carica]
MENGQSQSQSPRPSPVGGELGQGDDLLQRSGERRRKRGVPADGAGAVELEPGVEAAEVEAVAALRHHSQHLRSLVLAKADRAGGLLHHRRSRAVPLVRKLRVGVNDALVKTHDGAVVEVTPAVVVVVLGDEDDSGEDYAVMGVRVGGVGVGGKGGGGGGGGVRRGARGAAADVGSEEEEGEDDEEAEGDGDGVAEPQVGEVVGRAGGGGGVCC